MKPVAIVVACGVLAGCAAKTPPAPIEVLYTPGPLVINDTLPDDARMCVSRNPFNDPRLVCEDVGVVRRMIRGRALVADLQVAR